MRTILRNLIDVTRANWLEGSLAREVSALKANLSRAREEGGIDAVLSIVSNNEAQIIVRVLHLSLYAAHDHFIVELD